jgi:hypothetical protein
MSCERNVDLQLILEERLERLKRKLGIGYELTVVWAPRSSNLSGEVKDSNIIYVYEKDVGKALETLTHEFIDYAISRIIEPYKEIANTLIMFTNKKAYNEKEKLIEALSKLISQEV